MDGKVPIIETAQFGFKHLRDTAQPSAIAAAIIAAPSALCVWAAQQDPANVVAAIGLSILAGLLQLPFAAAHYRVSARSEPLRLGLGGDEARLLGASIALGFFNFIIFVIGGFFTIILMGVLLAGSGIQMPQDPGTTPQELFEALGLRGVSLLVLSLLPLLVALVWVSVRLILVGAATIGERRVLVFETWSWTKGNFLRLLGAVLLLAVPLLLGAQVIASGAEMLAGGSAESPAPAPLGLAATYVGLLASLFLVSGPLAGQAGYFFRGLKP